MLKSSFVLLLIIFFTCTTKTSLLNNIYSEEHGFVSDSTTAVKIAETAWLKMYGKEIYSTKPFTATLKQGIWIVHGNLPELTFGGVPYAEIIQKNGKVIKLDWGE